MTSTKKKRAETLQRCRQRCNGVGHCRSRYSLSSLSGSFGAVSGGGLSHPIPKSPNPVGSQTQTTDLFELNPIRAILLHLPSFRPSPTFRLTCLCIGLVPGLVPGDSSLLFTL